MDLHYRCIQWNRMMGVPEKMAYYYMVFLGEDNVGRNELAEYFEHYFDETGKEPENRYVSYAAKIRSTSCRTILIPYFGVGRLFEELDQKKIEKERSDEKKDYYDYPKPNSALSFELNYGARRTIGRMDQGKTIRELFYGEGNTRTPQALIIEYDGKGTITGYKDNVDLTKTALSKVLDYQLKLFTPELPGFPLLHFSKK